MTLTIEELKILVKWVDRWDNYEHKPFCDLIAKIEKFLEEEK